MGGCAEAAPRGAGERRAIHFGSTDPRTTAQFGVHRREEVKARKCGALAALLIASSACHRSEAHGKKVIVLGVDGMDPGFLERHWKELPNVARLKNTGGFQRLKTTTPPQSPVAWSTFITGLDPAEHGIFDFVHRDPKTMQPFSSMSRTDPPGFQLPAGHSVLPLSSARVTTLD